MKKVILSLMIVVVLASPVAAAGLFSPWVDMWDQGAYYGTNFENNSFSTYLVRSDNKIGINLLPLYGDTYLMPYYACEIAYSQDSNYWNNYLNSGIGIQIKPFARVSVNPSPINELKVFYESLTVSYLKDETTIAALGRPNQDVLYGLDLYYEWNQPRYKGYDQYTFGKPWSEVWANLAFHQTNFYQSDFNSYILRLEPKWGLYLWGNAKNPPRLEPYLASYLTMSGRNYTWLNRVAYGLGFRVQPFRYIDKDVMPWMFKFKMFFEVLGLSYLKEQPATNVSSDIRLGIDFTIGR